MGAISAIGGLVSGIAGAVGGHKDKGGGKEGGNPIAQLIQTLLGSVLGGQGGQGG